MMDGIERGRRRGVLGRVVFMVLAFALFLTSFQVVLSQSASAAGFAVGTFSPGSNLANSGGTTVTVSGSGFQQTGPAQYLQVEAGSAHACAVAFDGNAYCWGYGLFGELGNNSTNNSPVPVAVDTSGVLSGLTVKDISAGWDHTCVIASNNQAYCWGWGQDGELGNNSTNDSSIPVAVDTSGVLSGLTVKDISVGGDHTCAIASNNQVYCWGWNADGQLGNNSTNDSSVPVAVSQGAMPSGSIKQISVGDEHTCAIASNNQVYCWGWNADGQLGNNSTNDSSVPVAVDTSGVLSGLTVKQVFASGNTTCAIASNDQAYCWGHGSDGELGNNSTNDSSVPVAVDTSGVLSGLTLKQVSPSWNRTCAIASDNNAYCWGDGGTAGFGSLGDGTTNDSSVPVAVSQGAMPVGPLKQISAGDTFVCVIASDNHVYCWGYGGNGELGNNSTNDSLVPVAVSAINIALIPTITVGGVAATDVVVVSDTQISFKAPALAGGTYDVVISYGGDETVTETAVLTYAGDIPPSLRIPGPSDSGVAVLTTVSAVAVLIVGGLVATGFIWSTRTRKKHN